MGEGVQEEDPRQLLNGKIFHPGHVIVSFLEKPLNLDILPFPVFFFPFISEFYGDDHSIPLSIRIVNNYCYRYLIL